MTKTGILDEIKCQMPHDKKGCYVCGGFGVVIVKRVLCDGCKKTGWVRPHDRTIYDGLELRSFDGLDIICHPSGALCLDCEKTKEKKT